MPEIRAASTSPALDIIIKTGSIRISETTNPKRSSANTHAVTVIVLPLAALVILLLTGQRIQRSGRARYVRPIKNPASNPAVRAPISEAEPNATNVHSDSRSNPISG